MPSYIDDVGLIVIGKNGRSNCRDLERMANLAVIWGEANALAFNSPKIELLHFHSKSSIDVTEEAKVSMSDDTVI